jgi:hypothetical protein
MNPLLEKFNDYRGIVNYHLEYEFDNGDEIDVKLTQTAFPHLIGLHKLVDIPLIGQFNDQKNKKVSARFINSRIKKEEILTDTCIRSSKYFRDIRERYENFSKETILSLSYTDAIVNFNPSLICSMLSADYILFEKKHIGYNHLCIGQDCSGKRYAESFFYHPNDSYIRKQKLVKVKKIRILDSQGMIFLEDEFETK